MEKKNFKVWESQYPESWFSCKPGKNGFLPIYNPLSRLPEEYNIINNILDEMKITQKNNEGGYLAKGCLANIVDNTLPIYDLSNINNRFRECYTLFKRTRRRT